LASQLPRIRELSEEILALLEEIKKGKKTSLGGLVWW